MRQMVKLISQAERMKYGNSKSNNVYCVLSFMFEDDIP